MYKKSKWDMLIFKAHNGQSKHMLIHYRPTYPEYWKAFTANICLFLQRACVCVCMSVKHFLPFPIELYLILKS